MKKYVVIQKKPDRMSFAIVQSISAWMRTRFPKLKVWLETEDIVAATEKKLELSLNAQYWRKETAKYVRQLAGLRRIKAAPAFKAFHQQAVEKFAAKIPAFGG
jgi:hypothetical protein